MKYQSLLCSLIALLWVSTELQAQNKSFEFGLAWQSSISFIYPSMHANDIGNVFAFEEQDPLITHNHFLEIGYLFNQQVKFKSGIGLMTFGTQSRYQDRPVLTNIPVVDPNGIPIFDGTAVLVSPQQEVETKTRHHFLVIPAMVQFHPFRKAKGMYLTAGVQAAFHISTMREQRYSNPSALLFSNSFEGTITSEDTGTDYRKVNLFGTMGFGYLQPLNNYLALYVETNLTSQLARNEEISRIGDRYGNLGLKVGVLFGNYE